MNLSVPEKYGGPGLAIMDEVIIGEELAYGCSGISTALAANSLAVCLSPAVCWEYLIWYMIQHCVWGWGGGGGLRCSYC